ncbi:MAG: periplasmic heavy metal sensor [Desulfamplus sp.]|nr:periplasmic heavy metal sensor [Desulfamplus sp.]
MRKEILVALTVALTLVAMVGSAFAWECQGRKGKGERGEGCGQEWAKLTDEQKSELKELHQKFTDETTVQREALISKHEEIKTIIDGASPDKEKLYTLAAEAAELKKQIMEKRIDMALSAKEIAPGINLGFNKFGKHGCGMMGNCGDCGKMGKTNGAAKMNCPAMNLPADETE